MRGEPGPGADAAEVNARAHIAGAPAVLFVSTVVVQKVATSLGVCVAWMSKYSGEYPTVSCGISKRDGNGQRAGWEWERAQWERGYAGAGLSGSGAKRERR